MFQFLSPVLSLGFQVLYSAIVHMKMGQQNGAAELLNDCLDKPIGTNVISKWSGQITEQND